MKRRGTWWLQKVVFANGGRLRRKVKGGESRDLKIEEEGAGWSEGLEKGRMGARLSSLGAA